MTVYCAVLFVSILFASCHNAASNGMLHQLRVLQHEIRYQEIKEQFSQMNQFLWSDPLVDMTAAEMIKYNGYPVEEHQVQTDDGYLLGMQRIPGPRNSDTGATSEPEFVTKPAILLQHGLLACSTNWVSNLPNESLAYILADAGYDVWLGNVRGNVYSTDHISLDIDSREFWDFSFDEMAGSDIPAMIDYVLKQTGNWKLDYVGHSQGTMIGFAAFSQDHRTANKVKTFFALAPVTTVGSITSPMRYFAPLVGPLDLIFTMFGYNDFLPQDDIVHSISKILCKDTASSALDNEICDSMFGLLTHKTDLLNASRMPVYLAHFPAGTSTKNIAHFGQLVNSDKFCKYDYGYWYNNQYYGQPVAPEYDLSNMKTRTVLFSGGKDSLADPTDVAGLVNKLPTTTVKDHFKFDNYGHADFIWATTAATDVYSKIIEILNKQ